MVGPGCSSVGAGAFIEHGPFKINGETLVKNEYSWNTGKTYLNYLVDGNK